MGRSRASRSPSTTNPPIKSIVNSRLERPCRVAIVPLIALATFRLQTAREPCIPLETKTSGGSIDSIGNSPPRSRLRPAPIGGQFSQGGVCRLIFNLVSSAGTDIRSFTINFIHPATVLSNPFAALKLF
ncbi:hypothetical protein BOTBODRAFT_35117 [Botryobasidium botryosum FD-172 SS1]|uniref:Uncharacterized protein n=1 Tax=Botryobasidium botryosum (strain FD-172 SS1) TaxID=930990 RepID=A0A067M7D3_BOTB1|nr:hypothetical protein BOTBODRAFT_35117 [Botryobasidium botryosum FD-172 SS1]